MKRSRFSEGTDHHGHRAPGIRPENHGYLSGAGHKPGPAADGIERAWRIPDVPNFSPVASLRITRKYIDNPENYSPDTQYEKRLDLMGGQGK